MKHSMSMRRALVIQFASKYANIAMQLIVTAVLARIVPPEEHGLMAIVTVFTSFFTIFADMGIGPAIVQFEDLDEKDLGGLLTFSLCIGPFLAALFCLASFPISWFYGDSRLIGLCVACSPSLAFHAANMVPNGILLRNKRFESIGIRLLVSTLFAGLCAIAIAYIGAGMYALVINVVVQSIIALVWNLIASSCPHPNRHIKMPLRRVLSYSTYQAGFSIINYFSRNLDNILLGRCFGTTQLGYYDKAYKLSTYPLSFLASIVGSVLQPFLREYHDRHEMLYEKWVEIAKILSLVAAPLTALLFCSANEVIRIAFGDNWGPSIQVFRILSISVYFQIINNPTGAIFQSAEHTDMMFRHSLVATFLTLTGLSFGLIYGSLKAVSVGISIAYCLHTVSIAYFLILKSLEQNPLDYLSRFVPELLISIVAAIVCFSVHLIYECENIILSFVMNTVIICIIVISGYVITGDIITLKRMVKP